MAFEEMRRREPASRELAANDANPNDAERGRHDAHAMERRGAVVKMRTRTGQRIGRRQNIPFFRIVGYDGQTGNNETDLHFACVRVLAKTAKRNANQTFENTRFREIARFRAQ
jgi:hypothetical protein